MHRLLSREERPSSRDEGAVLKAQKADLLPEDASEKRDMMLSLSLSKVFVVVKSVCVCVCVCVLKFLKRKKHSSVCVCVSLLSSIREDAL